MGNYLGPEIPHYYQSNSITQNMLGQLGNLGSSTMLSTNGGGNIWNYNAPTSNYDAVLTPYVNSLGNTTSQLMNEITQPVPYNPMPQTVNFDPVLTPYVTSLNNTNNQLINEVSQPMQNIQMADPFAVVNDSMQYSILNPIRQQTQSLMSQVSMPMQMPTAQSPVTTPTVDPITGQQTLSATTPAVDPVTGMPVNPNNQAMQEMAGNYNQVAAILNDPRQAAKFNMLSDQLKNCLKDWWVDDRSEVKNIINQLKPEELAALEIVYGQKFGEPDKLRKELRNHFKWLDPNRNAPEELQKLNEAALLCPTNAVIALKDAMNGSLWNIDKNTLNQIISNSDPEFLTQVAMEYQQQTGKSLAIDLKNKLWWAGGDNNNLVQKITTAMTQDRTQSGLF